MDNRRSHAQTEGGDAGATGLRAPHEERPAAAVTPRMLELLQEVHQWPAKYQEAEVRIAQHQEAAAGKDATIHALSEQLAQLQAARAADVTNPRLPPPPPLPHEPPHGGGGDAAGAAAASAPPPTLDAMLRALEARLVGSLSAQLHRELDTRLAANDDEAAALPAVPPAALHSEQQQQQQQQQQQVDETDEEAMAMEDEGKGDEGTGATVRVPRAQLAAMLEEFAAAAADSQLKSALIARLKAALCELMDECTAALGAAARVAALTERAELAESEAAYFCTIVRCTTAVAVDAAAPPAAAASASGYAAPRSRRAAVGALAVTTSSPLAQARSLAGGHSPGDAWAPASRRSASTLGGLDGEAVAEPGGGEEAEGEEGEVGGRGEPLRFADDHDEAGALEGGAVLLAGGARQPRGAPLTHAPGEARPSACSSDESGADADDDAGSVVPWVEHVVFPLPSGGSSSSSRGAARPDFMTAVASGRGVKRKQPAADAGSGGGGGSEASPEAGKRARTTSAATSGGGAAAAPPRRRAVGGCTSQDVEALSNDVQLLQRQLAAAADEAARAAFVNDALLAQMGALRLKFNGRLVALEAAHRDELAVLRTEHAVGLALHLQQAAAAGGAVAAAAAPAAARADAPPAAAS